MYERNTKFAQQIDYDYFNYKKIFISGGSGSWGKELTKRLIKIGDVNEIIIYSRNENSQVSMSREINALAEKYLVRVRFIPGDIRDKEALNKAMRGCDIVFHLAALKHVPVCQEYPEEAIKTNVQGTKNMIECALENNVKMFIYCSTDKAVDPINFYGMTKQLSESLVSIAANQVSINNTEFRITRCGNAIGSNGSVIPFWLDCITKDIPIPITDKDMTRFWCPLEDAISMLLYTASTGGLFPSGSIFVPTMMSFTIERLARILYEIQNKTPNFKNISTRKGEKIHETIISEVEMKHAVYLRNGIFVILESVDSAIKNMTSYRSNTFDKLSDEDIKKFIKGVLNGS